MLFNKYQYYDENITQRGYSKSVVAHDEHGDAFWIKWILGIHKADTKAHLLADKLRHLQKGRHIAIPEIKEYGFDDEQNTFAIVYSYLDCVDTLEDRVADLRLKDLIAGLVEIAECLQELHHKHKITHGDIAPANILVGKNNRFYVVDFGLFDITTTLSQHKDLEIFARAFAAPEKLDLRASKGFSFQSDIYSFGKIIAWSLEAVDISLEETQMRYLDLLISDNPAARPSWPDVINFLKNIPQPEEKEGIQVEFIYGVDTVVLSALNTNKAIFDVSADAGDNIIMDIVAGDYLCRGVLWLLDKRKLLFDKIEKISDSNFSIIERKKRVGKCLPLPYFYTNQSVSYKADMTPFFKKWQEAKLRQSSLRENRKAVRADLSFYKELLKKEIEVIETKSLRLRYHKYQIDGDEIIFYIKPEEKISTIGKIQVHIEEGNAPDSEGFSYLISAVSQPKKKNDSIEFSGKPYDFDTDKNAIKIKDCERLDGSSIPNSGFLFENVSKKKEEKQRQRQAINKVENNEVQNPDLIYYLFKPEALPATSSENSESLENVKQRDKESGQPFKYTYNQARAITNALKKGPLTVIQGPPGTGKTTVITEIVFQLLATKPDSKILITSQTNNAVDQVLENLLNNDIPIVRLSGFTPPKIAAIKQHTLERKLEGWKQHVKVSAERNFNKLKKTILNEADRKGPFHRKIVDLLLNDKEWKKTREIIINTSRNVTSLKPLVQLPEDRRKAIAIIASVSGIDLVAFFLKYEIHVEWLRTINALDEKSAINQKLIDSIRVIGATCNHIAARKYAPYNFEFDYVIMDESGKATVSEALVPITMGNNLVFVGDHRQLKPMLTSSREVEAWLRKEYKENNHEFESWDDYSNRPSLFEQVINNIDYDYQTQLTDCRRSSSDQVRLTSQFFYESFGDRQISYVDRSAEKEHCLPLSISTSILFVDIGGHSKHEKDDNGSSYNPVSAEAAFEVLSRLNSYQKVRQYSIGIISGYSAQKKLLDKVKDRCHQKRLDNILIWKDAGRKKIEEKLSVSVFDRFQGLERDIMIVDLVKSGPGTDLGFLEVPNRINVALSRQKKMLIIIGDYYGITGAKTKRLNGEKSALQKYLLALDKNWIVKTEELKTIFK